MVNFCAKKTSGQSWTAHEVCHCLEACCYFWGLATAPGKRTYFFIHHGAYLGSNHQIRMTDIQGLGALGKFSTSTNCTKWAVDPIDPVLLAFFWGGELYYPAGILWLKNTQRSGSLLTNRYNVKRVWKLVSDSEKGTLFWKFRLWNTKNHKTSNAFDKIWEVHVPFRGVKS